MGTLTPGTLVYGRYHIVQPIGQGGFGAVYEAIDNRLGHRVALKQLLRGGTRLISQFEQEARLLANLSHPALPRVTDHFSFAGDEFLVMDFVPGKDLAAVQMDQDRPFAPDQVLSWGLQLLDALQYLHNFQLPICHRDIKPQNLKLKADGTIMLLDFGLAKGSAQSRAPSTMESSLLAYTKGYAPPEQVEGLGTDTRSDLYSLAGTLHCLLTNTPPVDAQLRLLAVARGRPDPLRPAHEINPAVPEAVGQVLMQALALEPSQRPASAEVMRTMLESARGPVAASSPAAASAHSPAAKTALMATDMLSELLGIAPAQPQPAAAPQAATAYQSVPRPATYAPAAPQPATYAPALPRPTVYVPAAHTSFPASRPSRRPSRLVLALSAVSLVAVLALLLVPLTLAGRLSQLGSRPSPTAEPQPTPAPLSPAQIAEKLGPSTLMISADFPPTAIQDSSIGAGSGFVLDSDGHIVTNAHVVEGASSIRVALPNAEQTRPARVVGSNTCEDIAVLKVENTEGLVPAPLGSSAALQLGDSIVALGYPMSFDINNDLAITRGGVSRLDVTQGHYKSLIQIDAPINPGNSGGPLANESGEVVGINSLGYSSEYAANVGFAISIDHARGVIEQLRQGRSMGWLGMNLEPNLYPEFFGTELGVVVAAVDTRSPASAIGVQPADLLVKLAGTEVTSRSAVCEILESHADGDALDIQLLRVRETGLQLLGGSIIIGEYLAGEPQLEILKEGPLGDAGSSDSGSSASGGSSSGSSASGGSSGSDEATSVTYSDDFSHDQGTWITGQADWGAAAIDSGAYHVILSAPNWYFLSPALAAPAGQNMGVAADVLVHGDARAGVALRYSERGGDRSYYTCWIDYDQYYGCFVSVDDHWTTLAEKTYSPAILPGQVNTVALITSGSNVILMINGESVASFTDGSVAVGVPALYLENFDSQAGASFDNVVVLTPNN